MTQRSSVNSDHIAPGVTGELVGVTPAIFRVWRKKAPKRLDEEENSYFTRRDLFVFCIMKAFSVNRGVSSSDLGRFNWLPVFDICNKTTYNLLKQCRVLLDYRTYEVHLLPPGTRFDIDALEFRWVGLANVYSNYLRQITDDVPGSKGYESENDFLSLIESIQAPFKPLEHNSDNSTSRTLL